MAPLAIRDVTISIPRGRFVAVVGRSGSGKSTLASLLAGLFLPTTGTIRYDGHDMASLDIRSLRSQIGMVTQDVVLFPGTVRENVSLLDAYLSPEYLERACRLACIDEEITALPMGYQTQRLAIARALVQESAVLVLDETTTALDAALERRIVQNLRGLPATKLVITHRIPAITDADLILVMRDGQVVEEGTHASLWTACGEDRRLAEPWFVVKAPVVSAPRALVGASPQGGDR